MEANAFFEALRAAEFSRLDRENVAYLDYAGSAMFGESQIRAHHELLLGSVLGNPHSEHGPSRASTRALDEAREAVLAHFGVSSSTHAVCFTANTTAAIRLVAEGFEFGPGRGLLLTADNHNSVNGIREYARRAGAPIKYVSLNDELRLEDTSAELHGASDKAGLFALPAQSNFSGVKHPLSPVAEARSLGWRVLLDAAAFAPTSRLDLSHCDADFVPISFYKMFGYPTGIGALIARRDALAALRRPWFSGGTVDYVSVQHDRHQLRPGHEGFEDGTSSFEAALAIPIGLEFINRIEPARLSARMDALTGYFLEGLRSLRHDDGSAAVIVHGPSDTRARGATVAFNLVDGEGHPIPYWEVESAARDAGIAIRGGCFCNPGAAEAAFHFESERTLECFEALGRDFTIPTFAACLGPSAIVGAVRVSMGIPTTLGDLDKSLRFLALYAEREHDAGRPRHGRSIDARRIEAHLSGGA